LNYKPLILQITNRHFAEDDRIFHKIALSIAETNQFEVKVLAPEEKGRIKSGVEIVDTTHIPKARRFKAAREIASLAVSMKPYIIHFHEPYFFIAWNILKKSKAKLIYDSHEYLYESMILYKTVGGPFYEITANIAATIENWGVRRCDAIVAINEYMAERFRKINPRSIACANFTKRETGEKLYQARKIIPKTTGYAGVLSFTNGLQVIAETMEILSKEIPDCTCKLVGFPNVNELETAFKVPTANPGRNLGNATYFLGPMSYEGYLKEFSSWNSGWIPITDIWYMNYAYPIKLFEMMALGMPFVASEVELMGKIVKETNCGILVKADRAQEHATAHKAIWEDPDLARKLGENGRQAFLDKYCFEKEFPKLLNLYWELLDIH
jgi:glycosyltransferase involved in cell wall biosynthesis